MINKKLILSLLSMVMLSCCTFDGKADQFNLYGLDRYDNAPAHSVRNEPRRYHKSLRKAPVAGRALLLSSSRQRYQDDRPRAWCGWYMRTVKGGGPSFNVAANWRYYGSPASPGIGAVVVWPHHVGYISGQDSRGWLVTSGNYDNRVATVPLNRMPRNVIAYRI